MWKNNKILCLEVKNNLHNPRLVQISSTNRGLFLYSILFLIKNVSFSTSHKKNSVFTSIRLYENLWPNPSPNAFPKLYQQFSAHFPLKRERDDFLFCALTRRKFLLRLNMNSWGQFYVTERFYDFLKLHNLLIKLQPWLMFLWTTFCPCLLQKLRIVPLTSSCV